MSYVGWVVLLTCLLAGGTLFFSVHSIALRTFSRVKLQEAFRELNKENLADRLAERAEKLALASALYRIIFTVCILLLLVGAFIHRRPNSPQITDYVLPFVIATVLLSVFGLAVPHAWAKYAGEKTLSRTYALLVFCALIASPLLYVWGFTDGLVRRLAGVAHITPKEQREEKEEEFLNGLEQHKMEGVVDEEEQQMIENVLELSDSTADEIMTPRTDVVAVEASSDLQAVLDTINTAGHSRVPIYEDNIDNIIGFVYAKDLLTEIGRDPGDFRLRDKIRDAYFVPETKPLRALLHEFQNQKLHIAVVLDEYGGTAGIVTLEDILEELVGEITDEYEKASPKPTKRIDDSTFEADARMPVDDLNDEFELNLPENEDYDTLGGFVFARLGYVPKTGETFDYYNLKFTIVSAERRRIRRIRIRKTNGKCKNHNVGCKD